MADLLEYKEKIQSFFGRYEAYLIPVIKCLLALCSLLLINFRIGYMERLQGMAIVLLASLVCAILPLSAMLLLLGLWICLNCYALSVYAGLSVFVLFVFMYLVYFRFAASSAYNVILTPISFCLGIPYVMPVANGLLEQPYAVIPTVCGTVTYFFLEGIRENATVLSEPVTKDTLIPKFASIFHQLADNKEMFLTIGVFVATTLIVYIIRRMSIDYAWTIAITVGMILEFLVLFIGYLSIGMTVESLSLLLGCTASTLLLVVIQFFLFNLDYIRAERVQFEDDEYYYYVKAIPKRHVPSEEKVVMKISGAEQEEEAPEDSGQAGEE